MSISADDNKALAIGEIAAQMFQPAGSPEAEMLNSIEKFTLQLRLDQQLVINKLFMAAQHPKMRPEGKSAILAFITEYNATKRHQDSRNFMVQMFDKVSLSRLWNNQNFKGQITKMQ